MTPIADTTPGGAEAGSRRRLRNYLLDPALQFRLASYLVAVVAALATALGWLLWSAYRETSRVILIGDSQANEAIGAVLAREDRLRMLWLALGLLVVIGLLLAVALIVTHRIAGPAHAIAQTCREITSGSLPRPRTLRRRDLLTDLAVDVASMLEALRERELQDRDLVARAAAAVRRGGGGASDLELAEALERLAEEKRRRLGA